jgi:pimeloyl-ACP methyl ester carboxylesterase
MESRNVSTTEHRIGTERGHIFAKSWTPGENPDQSAAILLFHDSLGCVDLWREFPEHLAHASRRVVVAYDRLGFGRSDAYPGQLPEDFICAEAETNVNRLCEQLGIGAIVPFGHSVGGAMAILTAARLPDRCYALVTESAQAFVEDLTVAGIKAAQLTFQEQGQLQRLERYHGAKARWVLDAWIETWLSPNFRNWNIDSALRSVYCPVLAIHGDRDEYGSPRHSERIVDLVPGPSTAVIIPECGHVPHREKQDHVLRHVTRFLSAAGERCLPWPSP